MKSADQLMSDIQLSLQALFQKIQPEMLESMEKQGVTPAQLFVLASLKKHGSLKISEIAERMEVKPSAVTLMADRLEQKNLIARTHNTKDRKFEEVLAGRKAIMARYLSFLTEEEMLQAAHITAKLAQAAETDEKQNMKRGNG